MWKYTIDVDGMMCGMCESHCNSAIRMAFEDDVKKITSNHGKKKTEVIANVELNEDKLRKTITDLGYDVGNIVKEPYEKKKGLLGLFG